MEYSQNYQDTKSDCLSCKLVSFFGLTGSGVYVAYQAKIQKGIANKAGLAVVAFGLTYMGVARLANLYPFRTRKLEVAE